MEKMNREELLEIAGGAGAVLMYSNDGDKAPDAVQIDGNPNDGAIKLMFLPTGGPS